ncbi:hypothetical protein BCR37DRAFT_376431 [Protomyces lactucae-debilis]|uniref:Uncharacterized protein n=1 Tax=Protomyces lactucae-debilis TaxID=2754530 RepID=A0A1Y2FSU1_PROLT|nr:uncharacterized protein BCR37DRAFT_376431 [Protomyces lactucae-debilis]ORY87071.1 hypothetical protein BCR37DRAFT_376431 [Protomyces lactucae-debilis]
MYIMSKDMAGPWSDANLRLLGDLALFGSQSGQVQQVGNDYAMVSNIWGHEWTYPTQLMPAHEVDRQLLLPLSFADGREGVHAHFYPSVMYKDVEGVPAGQAMYGVQAGRILSQGQPIFQGGFGDGRETDGRYDSDGGWSPGQPERLSILGVNLTNALTPDQGYKITAVELHFTTVGGSEMFYNVIIGARHKGGRPLDDSLILGPGLFKMVPGFQHYDVASAAGSATFHEVRFYFGQALKMDGHKAGLCAALAEVTIYGF